MTSWALRASLQIVIEKHAGSWCTLGFLAGRVIAPVHVIRPLCDQLAAEGLVLRKAYYGEPIYGQDIVDDYPGVNDVRDSAAELGTAIGGGQPL